MDSMPSASAISIFKEPCFPIEEQRRLLALRYWLGSFLLGMVCMTHLEGAACSRVPTCSDGVSANPFTVEVQADMTPNPCSAAFPPWRPSSHGFISFRLGFEGYSLLF